MPRKKIKRPREKRIAVYVPRGIYKTLVAICNRDKDNPSLSDLVYRWILEKLSMGPEGPTSKSPGPEPEEGTPAKKKEYLHAPFGQ